MTRDDIVLMARGAWLERNGYWEFDMNRLEHFAALAYAAGAAAEREACAKVCEDDESKAWDWSGNTRVGNYFARAIRARGNT